jgi:hypothetical protein
MDSINRHTSRKINATTTSMLIGLGMTKRSTEEAPIEYPILYKPNVSVQYTKVDNAPNDYDKVVAKRNRAIAKLKELGIKI